MNANELADELERIHNEDIVDGVASELEQAIIMLRQQQAEIETLKKQIPDWENINKPNPFIGMSEGPNYKRLPPNSGLGGIALKGTRK
jgi:hypothetical protein